MNYAIVTNTRGRGLELVERSLRASLNQQPPPQQVVFIDQNTPALQLSADVAQNPRLVHLAIAVKSVSEARNSFSIPDVEWLVFCDDDGYLDPQYGQELSRITQQFPELQIIAGSIVRDDNGDYYTPRHKIGGSLQRFVNTKLLMGSNFAVKSKTFKKLGGFDEEFGAGSYWGSGEETDFAWKAFFAGIPMEFHRELIVRHIKPYAGDFRHSCEKAYRYGLGKGALTAKWVLEENQWLASIEIVEMFLVPTGQAVIALLRLRFRMIGILACSVWGRLQGFLRRALTGRRDPAKLT